jgi:hypothetical protein
MTATISELPLRPRPQAGEALLGYLLRIVNTNGYDSIQTFRKLFGLKSTLLHNLSIVSPNIDEVLRHLSGRVNIKVDVLKAHFDKEYDFFYDPDRAMQNIKLHEPNVCLACLKENRPIMASWRLAHATHCVHHESPLVTHCPECDAKLAWKPSLYSRCQTCNTPWCSLEITREAVPEYQRVEAGLTVKQRIQYYAYLYRVVRLATRFYDMQTNECRTFPTDIENRAMLFSYSYRFLTEPKFRESQLAARVAHWQKNLELQLLPNDFFAALHKDVRQTLPFLSNADEVNGFHICQFQTHQVLIPRVTIAKAQSANGVDHSSLHQKSAEHLESQLRIDELSRALGVKLSDMTQLARASILPAVNNPKIARDYWFDVAEVSALFAKLRKFSQPLTEATFPRQVINLDEAKRLVQQCKWTVANILSFVLSGKCPVFINGDLGVNFNTILLCRESLILQMDAYIRHNKTQPNASFLHQYFSTKGIVVEHFIEFIHETLKTQRNGRISHEEFTAFNDRFWCLNRWCRLRKISISALRKTLESSNFVPVYDEGAKKGFYLYTRSKMLDTFLTSYLKND